MNKFYTVFIVFSILSAYLVYSFAKQLDSFKSSKMHHDELCKIVNIDLTAEDLIVFGEFIVGASADYINLFSKPLSADKAEPGHLFTYHPRTLTYAQLPIENYPPELNFNPHGIHLFENKTLYIINHGFSKGGESVFLIELSFRNDKVHAKYINRIYLGEEHGIYNALTVLSSQYFFISQWLPIPFTDKGKDPSIINELLLTFYTLFFKANSVKLCLVLVDQAICSPRDFTYMPNGIVKIKNQLFVAESITKSVNIYAISESFELKLLDVVQFSHPVDNIHLNNNVLYVTGIERASDFLTFTEEAKSGKPTTKIPSGVSKMWKKGNKWISEEILMQDKLSLATSCVLFNNTLVLSSIADPSLLICPLSN